MKLLLETWFVPADFFRIFFLKMFQKHPMDGIFRAHSSAMPCRLIPVLPCAACFNFWSRGKFRYSKLKIWPLPNSLDVDISISLISASWSFFWDGLGVFFFFRFNIFWPTDEFGVVLGCFFPEKNIVKWIHLRWSCSLAWSFAPTFLRWHQLLPAIPPSWSSQRMMTTRNWPGWRWGLVNGVDEFLEMDGRQRESKHLETVTLR